MLEISQFRKTRTETHETVKSFAIELRKETSALLEQLQSAGIHKEDENSLLSDNDKQQLLKYLQESHRSAQIERKTITVVVRGKTKTIERSPSSLDFQTGESSDVIEVQRPNTNKVILVGNVGRGSTKPTYTESKAWYEVVAAFRYLFGRFPNAEEADALEDAATVFTFEPRRRQKVHVRELIARIRHEVDPQYLDVVRTAVYALAGHGNHGNRLSRDIFNALYAKGIPASQTGLHVGSGIKARSSVAAAAWRLLRLKHFLPSCVATISLA